MINLNKCLTGFLLMAVSLPTAAAAQDLQRVARNLESDAVVVWQGAQSRFLEMRTRRGLTPEDLQLYFDLNAFSRSATLLREVASMSGPQDLRGGIQSLVTQAVGLENLFDRTWAFVRLFRDWQRVQQDLVQLARVTQIPYAPLGQISVRDVDPRERNWDPDRDRDRDREVVERRPPEPTGRLVWRGRVDGEDNVRLSGDRVTVEHISAMPVQQDSYDLSAPLPAWQVPITLRRMRGRGDIDVLEQPSPRNGYTAVVRIRDSKSGSDMYEFELRWDNSEPASRIPIRP